MNFEFTIVLLLQGYFELLKCLLNQSFLFVWTTLNSVWFSCPCLSKGDDCGLKALDSAFNLLSNWRENVLLGRWFRKYFRELHDLIFCFPTLNTDKVICYKNNSLCFFPRLASLSQKMDEFAEWFRRETCYVLLHLQILR
jgi:hypothetical protein